MKPVYRLTSMLVLTIVMLTANPLRAENPAYTFAYQIGTTGFDIGNAIAMDGSDNIYVTGRFHGTVDFDPSSGTANLTSSGSGNNNSDAFVASYDASGGYRWAFNVGGTRSDGTGYSQGLSIVFDADGYVVVGGVFYGTADFNPGSGTANLSVSGSNMTSNMFVAKYSTSGTYQWAFSVVSNYAPSIDIDNNGHIFLAGGFIGTVDFNPGSGTASLSSAKKSGNQGYSVDLFIAKYSSAGAYQWAFKIGNGDYNESVSAVSIDGSGDVYVSGSIVTDQIVSPPVSNDFDPGKSKTNLTGEGCFVAKYTNAGAFTWAFKLVGAQTGTSGLTSQNLVVDSDGNVMTSGKFLGTVDFNPGSGTANLTSRNLPGYGSANFFIARYNSSGTYQWAFTPSVGEVNGMYLDSDGNAYVSGLFVGASDFDPGTGTTPLDTSSTGKSGFVASYSSAGEYQWAFPIVGSDGYGRGQGIVENESGDVFLTGSLSASADFDPSSSTTSYTAEGNSDIFIAKYSMGSSFAKAGIGRRLNEQQLAPLTIAPNPFTNSFALHCDETCDDLIVEIVDITGRVVDSRHANGSVQLMLGAEWPAGSYFVRTTQGATLQQVLVQKVR